jgi:hypothetical protein
LLTHFPSLLCSHTYSIYAIIKRYLLVNGKHQDAAPFLTAKFLTRPENEAAFLTDFVSWCLSITEDVKLTNVRSFRETGVLKALCNLFKIGKRDTVSPHGARILEVLNKTNILQSSDENLVKNVIKLTQRIGLAFLRVKDTSWQYRRGQRILTARPDRITEPVVASADVPIGPHGDVVADAGDEVPAELEEIIDCMISGLKKDSSVCRWSAAKGIGRLAARLSQDFAEAVVDAVIDLFNDNESGSAWHGGCLCLAELGRRGLILPVQLPRVLDVIQKAVVFDECKGCFSVGSNVRDAACYVCWSFARAYDSETLRPFVNDLASSLLIVAVFDREVNCRRAAAAAFQENVGRQGAMPDGIEIMTVVDYQTVGSRKHAFTELSSFLAKYEVYQQPMLRHLIQHKVCHWDSEIRELAADAVFAIALVAPLQLCYQILSEDLMTLSIGSDVNSRHGALMSLGSVIKAFHQRKEPLPFKIEQHVKSLVTIYTGKKFLEGFGSEFAKQGFCKLIESCAMSSFPIHTDVSITESWFKVVMESIFNCKQNQPTMDVGIHCIPVFLHEYVGREGRKVDDLLDLLMDKLRVSEEGIRCAAFAVIREIPILLLTDTNQQTVLNMLINSITSGKQADVQMAEARAAGILSLSAFLTKLPDENLNSLSNLLMDQVYRRVLVRGLKDYTAGFRGDIGFHVRRNSLIALKVSGTCSCCCCRC